MGHVIDAIDSWRRAVLPAHSVLSVVDHTDTYNPASSTVFAQSQRLRIFGRSGVCAHLMAWACTVSLGRIFQARGTWEFSASRTRTPSGVAVVGIDRRRQRYSEVVGISK